MVFRCCLLALAVVAALGVRTETNDVGWSVLAFYIPATVLSASIVLVGTPFAIYAWAMAATGETRPERIPPALWEFTASLCMAPLGAGVLLHSHITESAVGGWDSATHIYLVIVYRDRFDAAVVRSP